MVKKILGCLIIADICSLMWLGRRNKEEENRGRDEAIPLAGKEYEGKTKEKVTILAT